MSPFRSADDCVLHPHADVYAVLNVQSRSEGFLPENSCALSEKEARHILINYKRDAAGGSDPKHIGDDAFVETGDAFIPTVKNMTENGHNF